VLLGVLVVTSIGIFANSVMRYNALMEEQRALEEELSRYQDMREELEELLNSDKDYDYIVKIAKKKVGLYCPDEEIYYNDINKKERISIVQRKKRKPQS